MTVGVQAQGLFQPGDHCVGYKGSKKMFLFADVEVIGKSCDVIARVETKPNQVRFEVYTPIASFNSDNSLRDESVQEILKSVEHPDLRYISAWFSLPEIQKLAREGGTLSMLGELEVAGKRFELIIPLEIEVQSDFALVKGRKQTRFSTLDLIVPPVAGGVVAEASDEFEIQLQLRTDRIEGFGELVTSP